MTRSKKDIRHVVLAEQRKKIPSEKQRTHAVIEKTYAETNNQRTRTHMSYL